MYDIKDRQLGEELEKMANPKKYEFTNKEIDTEDNEAREGVYSF